MNIDNISYRISYLISYIIFKISWLANYINNKLTNRATISLTHKPTFGLKFFPNTFLHKILNDLSIVILLVYIWHGITYEHVAGGFRSQLYGNIPIHRLTWHFWLTDRGFSKPKEVQGISNTIHWQRFFDLLAYRKSKCRNCFYKR